MACRTTKLGQVDGVGALAQDHALRALGAPVVQEGADILEVVGLHVAGQGLGGGQVLAVPGEHVADLSLGDGHQRTSGGCGTGRA